MGDALYITFPIHSKLIKCKGKAGHVVKQMGETLKVGIRFEGLFKQDRLFLGTLISYVVRELDEPSPVTAMMRGIGFGLLLWAVIISAILALI